MIAQHLTALGRRSRDFVVGPHLVQAVDKCIEAEDDEPLLPLTTNLPDRLAETLAELLPTRDSLDRDAEHLITGRDPNVGLAQVNAADPAEAEQSRYR